jgi:3-oxoacyl-(acyl-carrier-protein) synthase
MKNVVVTGVGVVSCIGSNTQEVLQSLKKENQVFLETLLMQIWVLEAMFLGYKP